MFLTKITKFSSKGKTHWHQLIYDLVKKKTNGKKHLMNMIRSQLQSVIDLKTHFSPQNFTANRMVFNDLMDDYWISTVGYFLAGLEDAH